MSIFKKFNVLLLSLILLVGVVACSEEISTTTTSESTTESTSTTTTAVVSTSNPDLVTLMEVADTITIANADIITENFNLFAEYGVIDITWSSDNTEVITISPAPVTIGSSEVYPVTISPDNQDTVVELEATFMLNSVEYSKTYSITVKAFVDDGIYRSVSTLYDEATENDLVVFNGYVAATYKVGYVIMDNNGDSLIVYDTSSNYVNLVQVGDNVTVSGKYSIYHTLYQIKEITSQVINSSNNIVTITPVVLENASDLLDIDSSIKLNHGKVYTVTVTPILNANVIELFDGATKIASIYDNSLATSITALQGFVGREVTIDVLYYALHTTDGIRVLFYGTEEDIEAAPLTLEQQFAVDIDLINNPLELTDSLVLPSLEYSTIDSVTISTELTNYLSLSGEVFTITRPTSLEGDAVGTITIRISIGEEFRDVIVNVTVKAITGASATDLIISEYIEGGSFNKLIELYNGTSSSVDLSEYALELYSNGAAIASQSLSLSGTLLPGQTIGLYNSQATDDFKLKADLNVENSTVINFNGDDAIVLKHNGVIIDSIGQIGFDPGAEWVANGVSTLNMTLVRKSYITSGDTNPNDAYDPSVEWVGYPQDTFTYIGTHVMD